MHTQEEIENSKLELAQELEKLYKDKRFKKIILEGYLENGSVFLTKNYTRVKEDQKESLVSQLEARSNLWKYLDTIEGEARDIMEARAYEADKA